MRLKKTLPPSDPASTSTSSPPSVLRKPKPLTDIPPQHPPSTSAPRHPSTLKKASHHPRAMDPSTSSSRSSSSSSSSSSSTSTAEADVVSLNDDPDLKPVPAPSSSPTKLSQFTFRGWPVSRKPPSTFTPPPSRQGQSSTTQQQQQHQHVNYWSSVPPTNPHSQPLSPSSSSSTSSASSDIHRAPSESTSSSVYSVKVTSPSIPAVHHPFIPNRPYSAPVTLPQSPPPPPDPLLEQQRRRATANGILYQTIPEGAPVTSSQLQPASTRSHSSDGDTDGDSVGSDRSVIQAVTVVNDPDKYSLHIRLPGFNLNNLCIASRRDRSLLITADKFEDEVPRPSRSSTGAEREQSGSTSQHVHTASASSSPQPNHNEEQRPSTPPERLTGHFERCVQFGPDADPSKASARFDGETLVINVPKRTLWGDDTVEVISRRREGSIGGGESLMPSTPVMVPQVDKSPRSIALALGGAKAGGEHDGDVPAPAISPGAESIVAESTTSTTPEGEMTSGSSCTDISSVPSPMSEDGESPLDDVSRRLEGMRVVGDRDEEEESSYRAHQELESYASEPPTPTTAFVSPSPHHHHHHHHHHYQPYHHPTQYMPTYPFSPGKGNATGPSPIASWLSGTTREGSRSPSHHHHHHQQHSRRTSAAEEGNGTGNESDSSDGGAAARRHFGIEDDLVTPTPQRVQKRRAEVSGVGNGNGNGNGGGPSHHAVSPKKDYFGFPLTPILAANDGVDKTSPPKTNNNSSGSSASQFLKQRSPSRDSGGVSPTQSPSKMPLSLRRGSVAEADDEDVVEHMRISLPGGAGGGVAGRSREQGLGRSAFFWKRWPGAPGQGV